MVEFLEAQNYAFFVNLKSDHVEISQLLEK